MACLSGSFRQTEKVVWLRKYTVFFALLVLTEPLWAARLAIIKDNKALVLLEQDHAEVGDKYFVLNEQGRRIGLLQIKIVKGTKAVGLLLKGKAQKGDPLEKLSSAKDKVDSPAALRSQNLERSEVAKWDSVGYLDNAWGLMAASTQSHMKVTLESGRIADMKGGSTDFWIFFQHRLDEDFTGRLSLGMESLNVKGTISNVDCNGVSDCNVKITYLGVDPFLRLNYHRNRSEYWVGAGLNLLLALSKNSNAVKTEKISTNLALLAGTGIDWNLGGGHFIPVMIGYSYFPGNSEVQIQQLSFRLGYGYSF